MGYADTSQSHKCFATALHKAQFRDGNGTCPMNSPAAASNLPPSFNSSPSEIITSNRPIASNHPTHGVFRSTWLRSTLLGEYVSLGLLCHSMFGTLCWTIGIAHNPVSLLMSAAGMWIAFRSVGGFSGEYWTAFISALFLLATAGFAINGVENVPVWLGNSLVAPWIWSGMLGIVLLADYRDWRTRFIAGMTKESIRRTNSRHLFAAIICIWLLWTFSLPMIQLINQVGRVQSGKPQLEQMSFPEHAGFRFGEALVTACFFALGANIGSFLNVVAWRMPNGKSIVYEQSRCPVCGNAIAGKDNIPIFGWLGLGGRCRSCNVEISSRYPIVEAVAGSIFLLLYFVELISGGANLPFRPVNMYRGVLWIIMYAKWDLIGLYLYHCFYFSTLLVWLLMSIDGKQVPKRLLAFSFAVALGAPFIFPTLLLVPAWPVFPGGMNGWKAPEFSLADIALHGFAGVSVGTVTGALITVWTRNMLNCSLIPSSALVQSLALTGAIAGWQSVVTVAAVLFLVTGARRLLTEPSSSSEGATLLRTFVIVALGHHLVWRFLWS